MQATKHLKKLLSSDLFNIFSTSSPLSKERFELGLTNLRKLGYRDSFSLDPSINYGNPNSLVAGTIEQRINSFEFSKNPRIHLASRGAYGSMDLLNKLDFSIFQAPIVGCSDITVLLIAQLKLSGIPPIHGATLGSSFADYENLEDAKRSVDELIEILTNPSYRVSFKGDSLIKGKAIGNVIAGNLTMLINLLGTPFDIPYDGAILMFEESGEAPYRIQRMLTHLYLAGKFESLAGVVIGRLAKCESKNGPTALEAIMSFFEERKLKIPLLHAPEFGHWGINRPLPLGVKAKLDNQSFEYLDSPLE